MRQSRKKQRYSTIFYNLLTVGEIVDLISEINKLDSKVTNLWAKKRTVDGEQLWLPLMAHLVDTEQTINWLWNYWLSEGTKQIISSQYGEDISQKLVKFIGFSHDLGKATPVFQKKPSYDGGNSIDEILVERLIQSGFEGLKGASFKFPKKSPHALAGEALLMNVHVPESVAAIIGGHHGDAGDEVPFKQIGANRANYEQTAGHTIIDLAYQENWKRVQNEIINFGLKIAGFNSVSEIPQVNQTQAVLLEGLLITADWLSSGEYLNNDFNKPLFPLISIEKGLFDINLKERFQTAITNWDFGGEWDPQKVNIQDDPYRQRWGFNARPVQTAITDEIEKADDPGIAIIEAPMGIGKTEIALVAAEQMAYKGKRGGLFVGLPTQATSNAMFSRVQDWLEKLAKKQNENFPVKLMHGKAEFNDAYTNLPEASDIYEDENKNTDGSVVVNEWFSGKKSILSKFSVGTIDNLLLMALKQKHLFLRHLGFSEKVVIIDEAHAYDVYMDQYLDEALKWLGAYHVPVIVLSATLPKVKRVEFIKAYNRGKFGKGTEPRDDADEKKNFWKKSEAYPLLTLLDGDVVKQISEFPGVSDQRPLQLSVLRMSDDESGLIETVLMSIQGGGIAGIIVNTVQRAQELAELVPTNIKTIILHSSFLAPDRAKKEAELLNTIGKNVDRPQKMIVIGTQVLEQSLDIDFDILYTDIAPMDLILQRAGRLHRHQITRPAALQVPKLFIMGAMTVGDYGDQNESVYEKYLLMRTDYYLRDKISLPDDISNLVQHVYDFDNDPEMTGIDKSKSKFEKNLADEKSKAMDFRLSDPGKSRRDTLHQWLKRMHTNVDANDQRAAAAVRDIKESIEVILLQEKQGVVCLVDGTPISQCPSRIVAEQLIRLPTRVTSPIGDYIKLLEDMTSNRFYSWQKDKWLKGSLAIVLDENLETTLGPWQLKYSSNYGLKCEKEVNTGD